MNKFHDLKTWPEYFAAIVTGQKRFEARKNDRNYQVGDTLNLLEFNPSTGEYTGRRLPCEVTYILQGPAFGVEAGHCVMSIHPLA